MGWTYAIMEGKDGEFYVGEKQDGGMLDGAEIEATIEADSPFELVQELTKVLAVATAFSNEYYAKRRPT